MTKSNPTRFNSEKVAEWLRDADGYLILEPQFFRDMGMPENIVQTLAQTFSDDGEGLGKHAARRADGEPGDVWGISEFAAVNAVAANLGVEPCGMWHGRGKNFRGTRDAVLKAIAS